MLPNPQFLADLVTFTEEILNGKLHFQCGVIEESNNSTILPKKINDIVNYIWERWKREYLVNLREKQKIKAQNSNHPHGTKNEVFH